jgi:peptide subunit release factor RF-3
VAARVEPLSYSAARFVRTHASPSSIRMPFGAQLVRDRRGALVILLPSVSALQYAERENPDVKFLSIG